MRLLFVLILGANIVVANAAPASGAVQFREVPWKVADAESELRTSGCRDYHPRDNSSFALSAFSTDAQVSQSASSTLLYFTSNGFRVADVRSMS